MVACTWKFSKMKQILITLLLVSFCSIFINGIPIITTPIGEKNNVEFDKASEHSSNGSDEVLEYLDPMNLTEEGNNEYLYVMVKAPSIREILVKYFTALNNTDLLSACKSCISFCEIASEVLQKRIKPLIIINGKISDAIDQQIFPTYETTDDVYKDFLALDEWQSDFFLDDSNNPRSAECELASSMYLHVPSFFPIPEIIYSTFNKSDSNLSRDAILIPKVYVSGIADFQGTACSSRYFIPDENGWKTAIQEAKLVFVFSDDLWHSIESQMNFDILSTRENRPLSICYIIRNHPIHYPWYKWMFSFVIFHGSNVEASTFFVEANDEGELRNKLLEWKRGLNFLESHHIIAFYLKEEFVWLTNSEEIFRQIFGIKPFSKRLPEYWLGEAGLIHLNSTTNSMNYGPMFVIVGFKKF